MTMKEEFDRGGLIVPPKQNMVFKLKIGPSLSNCSPTSVEIEMPTGSSRETLGTHSTYSQAEPSPRSDSSAEAKYRGSEAWWSVGDFLQPGILVKNNNINDKTNDDDTWDLSDSLVDLYKEVNKYDGVHFQSPITRKPEVDVNEWIAADTNNGFVRVYKSDADSSPRLFPCTLSTTAQKLCIQSGMPPNSLHVQFNGDIIRRLEPFDSPLAMQNDYLHKIGYADQQKIQEVGAMDDLSYLVKFYAGKPVSDSTYSRNQLSTFAYVRKGKLLYQWVRRLCVITGTRLLIYRDKTKTGKPTIVQLAKGAVEEVQHVKGQDYVLKLTSTLQGERSVYLSFTEEKDYSKWLRKTKKATSKLPTKADLSNCHLEFLPETVFINDGLEILNLRHNVLKERPIEEDIYTIGWLDDLPRFCNLRSLNLADNDLRCFPMAVCKMRTLTELNLASNKLQDIPPDIVDLDNLQMLHLHNNHLNYLPDEMCRMSRLLVLVLAFNHFTTIPAVLLQSHESLLRIDSLIMAGNRIEKLPHDVLSKMPHIKKIDFRMNKLTLVPSEMAKFHLLELVTHLDVRDNFVTDLDVRSLRNLEYLNCDRNKIHSLQVSGGAIKTLSASHNEITSFSVSPKPEWLAVVDLSHNKLESLPGWISDCFFLLQLNASHNQLLELPSRLLSDAQKLKTLQLSHNKLHELPHDVGNGALEDLSLDHNLLTELPNDFFRKLPKLRYICLTNNRLENIPGPSENVYQNKLQELYLSANNLSDEVVPKICLFYKLKILHLAYNQITEIHDRDLRKLESLQELNISGNLLRHLPKCVGRHAKIQALRSNANLLKELPDFRCSPNLRVLEVGSNRLMDVSITTLMSSNVNLLDISGNPEMQVNSTELRGISTKKKVCMVDIKGQNRSLLDLRTAGFDDLEIPWQSGLSQTSGIRNKLSVSIVNKPRFNEGQEGLFALFDGGRNDEVIRILTNRIVPILEEEVKHPITNDDYLKYTILSAHRKLKGTGQKVGACGAICHIKKHVGMNHYTLHVANVGDTEVVIARRGEAVVISKLFTVEDSKEEMDRIYSSGGIITEDNKINGVTRNTRLLGSSYLFPHVIPEPYVTSTSLLQEDQLMIIANQGLWKYISYQEAVNEIIDIPDPVLAAKKLQDLAQGYRSQENIGILVVRLMVSQQERNRMRALLQKQFDFEQKVLAELKLRDIEREEEKKRLELEQMNEMIPMDIVKIRGGKKRKQIPGVFGADIDIDAGVDDTDGVTLTAVHGDKHSKQVDHTANWEQLLQKRLTEEVKDKELIHAMRIEEQDPYLPKPDTDNWSTQTKLKGQMKERVVTLPPKHSAGDIKHIPPPLPHLTRRQIVPEMATVSTESLEFQRELKHPLNVDRDAVLFHNMQLTRNKSRHLSTGSIDSTQSDPAYFSNKDISSGHPSSSHSIEVLIHGPAKRTHVGGSHKLPTVEPKHTDKASKVDSCPTEIPNTETKETDNYVPADKVFVNNVVFNDDMLGEFETDGHYDTIENLNLGKRSYAKPEEEPDSKHMNGHSGEMNGHMELIDDNCLYDTVDEMRLDSKIVLETNNDYANHDDKNVQSVNYEHSSSVPSDVNGPTDVDNSELYATVKKVKKVGEVTKTKTASPTENLAWTLERKPKVEPYTKSEHHKTKPAPSAPTIVNKSWTHNVNNQLDSSTNKSSLTNQSKSEVKKDQNQTTKTEKSIKPSSDKSPVTNQPYTTAVNKQSNATEKSSTTKESTVNSSGTNPPKRTMIQIQTKMPEKSAPIRPLPENSSGIYQPKTTEANSYSHKNTTEKSPPPPVPPRVPINPLPKSDINSNSLKSLEDLIAYNRLHQQKISYKHNAKAAPAPPPKVPDTTMVTKTASQRSIVITYL